MDIVGTYNIIKHLLPTGINLFIITDIISLG